MEVRPVPLRDRSASHDRLGIGPQVHGSGRRSRTKSAIAVFIQCVGSRIPERPYCSKVCCTHSVRNALKLKELNPDMNVYIVYRDMRPYGLRESLYPGGAAKRRSFCPLCPRKRYGGGTGADSLSMRFTDLCSAARNRASSGHAGPGVGHRDARREPPGADVQGRRSTTTAFYVEAHAKLSPVEFPTDGVFVCGLAHGPKPIDEAMAQAQAAASRADRGAVPRLHPDRRRGVQN